MVNERIPGVQESDEPEVNAFDIEAVKPCSSLSNQAPDNSKTTTTLLEKLSEGIFLFNRSDKRQTMADDTGEDYTQCRHV
jgi:hypothetical protein